MLKAKKLDEAKKFAGEIMAKAKKQDDPTALSAVAGALRTSVKENKELAAIALEAAEAGLKIAGEKDLNALIGVAETHFATGNKAKAREFGAKAMEAAEARVKPQVERLIKKYEDEPKEEKEEKKDDRNNAIRVARASRSSSVAGIAETGLAPSLRGRSPTRDAGADGVTFNTVDTISSGGTMCAKRAMRLSPFGTIGATRFFGILRPACTPQPFKPMP